MAARSAGVLLYRLVDAQVQFLLVHPGGPFWKNKDIGAWTLPKGEPADGEELLTAAQREFFEETGQHISGSFIALDPVKQKGGKVIHAFAVEGDFNPDQLNSNTFEMEWPPRSGKKQVFPEVDKAQWFTLEQARERINTAQVVLLEEVVARI